MLYCSGDVREAAVPTDHAEECGGFPPVQPALPGPTAGGQCDCARARFLGSILYTKGSMQICQRIRSPGVGGLLSRPSFDTFLQLVS